MQNLSQQKRQRMLDFLEQIKSNSDDEKTIIAINEIENELVEKKYGLVWEQHIEQVDEDIKTNVPVFTEVEDKAILSGIDDSCNFLLEGDNLHSLKLLEKTHAGKIDCIIIDPPYNTKSKDFKYDDTFIDANDSFKHSKWCSFMYERLIIARKLLSKIGAIFINIDDNEQAALKLLCDEVFGSDNFVANVIWEKKFSPQNDAKWLSDNHDFVLVYARNKDLWRPNLLERTDEMNSRYKNPDNDVRGSWTSGDFSVKTYNASSDYPITTPSGRIVNPPKGYCWRFSKETYEEMLKDNRVWFGENGDNVPRVKRFLSEVKQGTVCKTIWSRDEVGDTQEGTRDMKEIFEGEAPFTNPKPKRLIARILDIATSDDSIILDFFAGSGTTGQAVLDYNKVKGGNRSFILCTDNSVSEKEKRAFLKQNNLSSVKDNFDLYQRYLNEHGICSTITYKRLQKTIHGYSYKGEKRIVIFKKKLKVSDLAKMDSILDSANKLLKENESKYDSVKLSLDKGVVTVTGVDNISEYIEGIPANLRYYKTEMIPKSKDDDFYSVGEELEKHIKEMIQLENGISLEDGKYLLILNDADAENIEKDEELIRNCKAVYISSAVFLNKRQQNILSGVEIITIPDYYFEEELREVGEL